MPGSSTTAVQKTYKEETINMFATAQVNATGVQPTLITANGVSKGFTSVSLLFTPSRYEFTLDPSINVCNILGFAINLHRSPTLGFNTQPGFIVYDYTIGTAGTPSKISVRGATESGASGQLQDGNLIDLTLVITTSNTL